METDIPAIVSLILVIIWLPVEISRINFAYQGNINETFPELIAFLIFTIFFILPFSLAPYFQSFKYPHEVPLYFINYIFLFFEIIFGILVMCRFMNTQSASFYLRTAPLIDQKFKAKYEYKNEVKTSREVQLGLRKYEKFEDVQQDEQD
eukprot:CAMPEP_0202963554 /NCGR_PEP_ID=MMETSP1396-20130829/7563_1 /ASSEMBLY_ACC=CAM_ASM_000872 /TAXON_ID= /ORGANISM="Pseudokeronopsis sp., Strain Brazil" /LENGTH=148 /DNA_ID=CAMNT_0049684879 /DNA_START=401 /DNA_END=847 /DNA_ORIENTATION=-